MREMSAWTIAASLFFSVAIFTSSYDAATGVVSLAGAGNPAAVEQSLSAFVSRMGGNTVPVPKAMAEAQGKVITVSFSKKMAPGDRLERDKDWVLKEGKPFAFPAGMAGPLGITDGNTAYPSKIKAWQDDNDNTMHFFIVGTDDNPSIILTFKPADGSYSINWRTDVTGKLISTAYSDASGVRVVPNSTYADRFQAQIAYWDPIVPGAPSGIASNVSGS